MTRAANLKWLSARGFRVAKGLPTEREAITALRPVERGGHP
jgi:hypothetical protein